MTYGRTGPPVPLMGVGWEELQNVIFPSLDSVSHSRPKPIHLESPLSSYCLTIGFICEKQPMCFSHMFSWDMIGNAPKSFWNLGLFTLATCSCLLAISSNNNGNFLQCTNLGQIVSVCFSLFSWNREGTWNWKTICLCINKKRGWWWKAMGAADTGPSLVQELVFYYLVFYSLFVIREKCFFSMLEGKHLCVMLLCLYWYFG